MAKLIKKEQVWLNPQAGTGAYEIPNAADYVRAYDLEFTYEGSMVERVGYGGAMGRAGDVYGGTAASLKFMVDVESGGDGANPHIHPLLVAAGMSESDISDDASSSGEDEQRQRYVLSDSGLYLSAAFIMDRYSRALFDSLASAMVLTATAGEIVKLETTLMGRYNAEGVEGIIPVASQGAVSPIVARNASISVKVAGQNANLVDGEAIESAVLDFGLNVSQNRDIADVQGYAVPILTDRNPTLTLNPELANVVWHTHRAANTDLEIEISLGTEPNRLVIKIPKARLVEISDGDRNGVRTQELKFMLARDVGNDEFTLEFD